MMPTAYAALGVFAAALVFLVVRDEAARGDRCGSG